MDTKTDVDGGAGKMCAACGRVFGCGAETDACWCAGLTLTETMADELRTKFNDCLCSDCLKTLASGPALLVTHPDGTRELVAGCVHVDTHNFHEGMFDLYDARGNLLRQIDMGSGITWEILGSEKKSEP